MKAKNIFTTLIDVLYIGGFASIIGFTIYAITL